MAFSSDGKVLASGGDDFAVRIWNVGSLSSSRDGASSGSSPEPIGPVSCITASIQQGAQHVVFCDSSQVIVREATTGQSWKCALVRGLCTAASCTFHIEVTNVFLLCRRRARCRLDHAALLSLNDVRQNLLERLLQLMTCINTQKSLLPSDVTTT